MSWGLVNGEGVGCGRRVRCSTRLLACAYINRQAHCTIFSHTFSTRTPPGVRA